MNREVEDILVRELRQVAEGLEVPALPPLPEARRRASRWQPLLVAAAVLLVVFGALATLEVLGGGDKIQPAPAPSPSPRVPTEDATVTGAIPTTRPLVPYVLGRRLFVAGEQVRGRWAYVEGTETGWVGLRLDGSYWWGYDAKPRPLSGRMDQPPAVSPSGRYMARITDQGGQGLLTGAELSPHGEDLGSTPVDPVDRDGAYTSVAAVTDSGLVLTRGSGTALLWRPLVDGKTVDLATTAPHTVVLDGTPAGLLVVDGSDGAVDAREGEPYLADVSADGEITLRQRVPNHDALIASRQWLAWVPPGTLGGEVSAVDELRVQRVDGGDTGVLAAPGGWSFQAMSWRWEDEDHLVAVVVDRRGERQRMVRCSPVAQACVRIHAG